MRLGANTSSESKKPQPNLPDPQSLANTATHRWQAWLRTRTTWSVTTSQRRFWKSTFQGFLGAICLATTSTLVYIIYYLTQVDSVSHEATSAFHSAKSAKRICRVRARDLTYITQVLSFKFSNPGAPCFEYLFKGHCNGP